MGYLLFKLIYLDGLQVISLPSCLQQLYASDILTVSFSFSYLKDRIQDGRLSNVIEILSVTNIHIEGFFSRTSLKLKCRSGKLCRLHWTQRQVIYLPVSSHHNLRHSTSRVLPTSHLLSPHASESTSHPSPLTTYVHLQPSSSHREGEAEC